MIELELEAEEKSSRYYCPTVLATTPAPGEIAGRAPVDTGKIRVYIDPVGVNDYPIHFTIRFYALEKVCIYQPPTDLDDEYLPEIPDPALLETPLHTTYLSSNEHWPTIGWADTHLLRLLGQNALQGQHKQETARILFFLCVVRDQALRRKLITRYPSWWRLWERHIQEQITKDQFFNTARLVFALYPDPGRYTSYTPHELETIEDAKKGDVTTVRYQFEEQLHQLEAQLLEVAKTAPPPWIRVLETVAQTLRQEIKPLKALEREHHRQEAKKNVAAQLKLAVKNEKGDKDDG